MKQAKFEIKLIAPCGINCGICKAHLRAHNPCHGCNFNGQEKPKTRAQCRLRLCDKRKGHYCCHCAEFPCALLNRLDKRYRTRYGMSEIENLVAIRDQGIRRFVEEESRKWISDKGILCVHNRKYYKSRRKGGPFQFSQINVIQ